MFESLEDVYVKYAKRLVLVGNPLQAAIDVGVPADTAKEFLAIASTHPEVLRIVAEDEIAGADIDFSNAEQVKKYILAQLMKEANYRGPGANAAARISALKELANLTGIEPPKKIDVNNVGQGGMMMVPLMDASLWETSAEAMQAELKKAARE